jgi:hypothetical protein
MRAQLAATTPAAGSDERRSVRGGAALAVALLAAAGLAGCIQGNAPASALSPGTTALPASLVAYDGNLTTMALPAAFANGTVSVAEHLLGNRGGEPNLGITAKGNVFETAGENVMESTDHGKSWKIVFNLTTAFPDAIQQNPQTHQFTRSSDPMLWVDPVTSRIFAVFMTGLYCSNFITSDDEGATWLMDPLTCGAPVNDHEKVATSIGYGPDTRMVPANPIYPDVVYYCYNKLAASDCAVSFDGGLKFQFDQPVVVSARDGCGGINGMPAPFPDGSMALPVGLGCDGPIVAVTTDNGLTWSVRHGPTKVGSEELDPEITVTKDGTAYLIDRGKDHQMYLYRSKDKFQHWDGPWHVSPPNVTSTVFDGITSGLDGRIAMAYLGTRDTKEEPSKAPNATRWNLYVTWALDAESASPTFVTKQVTPDADPVQIGCVWLNGGSNPCRNLLDFIDVRSDKDGRAYVAFTDGCTVGCADVPTATDNQSRSRDGAVAVVDAGPSLTSDSWIGSAAATAIGREGP